MMSNWRFNSSLETLQKRAQVLANIRAFFTERGVLEVETPLMAHAPVTDPYLNALEVQCNGKRQYLQTSPEYAMKRLLSMGSGSIFQVCKAFRDDEQGRLHQPEFTLLEWYRVSFDDQQLMDEICELLTGVLAWPQCQRLSYHQVFQQHLAINPHQCEQDHLEALCQQHCPELVGDIQLSRDLCLQWLFSEVIEPKLGQNMPCFIYDYPASQAALAKVMTSDRGVPIAKRFELFYRGVELANGYWELNDASIQRQRFEQDLAMRKQQGIKSVPVDEKLLSALDAGLPDCAGVALGIDRLLMLFFSGNSIVCQGCF